MHYTSPRHLADRGEGLRPFAEKGEELTPVSAAELDFVESQSRDLHVGQTELTSNAPNFCA